MGGLLDAQVHIGRETAYNVPATLTRSIEAHADIAKLKVEYLQSLGMRAGLEAPRFDHRRAIVMGAEGSIEVDFANKGMGMLLRGMLGTAVAPVQQGATTAYKSTYQSSSAAADESLTVQIGRPPIDPTVAPLPFTYSGGVITEWSLKQSIGDGEGGQLKLELGMDFAAETEATALMSPAVYPTADFFFGWPDCKIEINSVQYDVEEFEIHGSAGRATDRYRLKQSTAKAKPIRGSFPEYGGSLTADFSSSVIYGLVKAGTKVPLVATWRGPLIATPYYNELVVTAQVQLTGSTPEVSLSEFPKQPVEFVCVQDDTNPSVKIEYTSTDAAF